MNAFKKTPELQAVRVSDTHTHTHIHTHACTLKKTPELQAVRVSVIYAGVLLSALLHIVWTCCDLHPHVCCFVSYYAFP